MATSKTTERAKSLSPAARGERASRGLRLGALALALSASSLGAPALAGEEPRRPNFLAIVADDMGFSDAGCYGGEIETPHLDRLAAEGLRFTQCYSTARCWPSRSALLTGYYPQQIRADPPKGRLPDFAKTLPHYLRPLGYRSYHSGKWHVPGAPRPVEDGGFDDSYSNMNENDHFAPRAPALEPPRPFPGEYYSTTVIADHAIRQLREHAERHRGRPFFSYVAFIAPHFPIQALPEDIERYRGRYREGWDAVRRERWRRLREMGVVASVLPALEPDVFPSWNLSEAELRARVGPGEAARAVPWDELAPEAKEFQALKMAIHAAMVYRIDREVGRILEEVRALGAWEDTVTIFVSDNGASAELMVRGGGHDPSAPPGSRRTFLCLGPGWSSASNSPFRLHKSWVHEGGIASPLIVHWPAGIRARGELRRAPVHFVDLVPTVLELARAPEPARPPGSPPFAGRSIVRTFAADVPLEREGIFFHHLENRAIRVGDWKLVSKGKGGPWELYDLAKDRAESEDLSAKLPEKVADLSRLWETWEAEFVREAGAAESPRG